MNISHIDDAWHSLPESTKFTLWLSASSLALNHVGIDALREWENIVNNSKATPLG